MRWNIPALVLFLAMFTGCSQEQPPLYSGLVEGVEVPVMVEVGGAVRQLNVEEGQEVKKGEVLAVIDQRLFQQQLAEAQAAVDVAQAALEEAQEGTRRQELSQAVYRIDQSESQIANLRSQLDRLQANLEQKEAQLEQVRSQWEAGQSALEYQQQKLVDLQTLVGEGAEAPDRLEAQEETVRQAEAAVEQLQAQWKSVQAQQAMAEKEIDSVKAQIQAALAQKKSAEAQLDLLQEGPTAYTLKQLIGKKKAAQARLEQARIQLAKTSVQAPVDGIVIRRNVTLGETVKPSFQLMTLLEKGKLEVKVYVPEAKLNQVSLGQSAQIRVDAYPGEAFQGTVTHISEQAEFTPKNVQTSDERTNMVFRVTIRVENGWEKLKPGMPADVAFTGGDAP